MSTLKGLLLRSLPDSLAVRLRILSTRRKVRRATWDNEPDLRVMPLFVKPGDVVVDIGANVGLYTKFMAELVGPSGKVLSIEPVPSTFTVLSSALGDLRSVEFQNVALSDRAGEAEMEIPLYESGYENYYQSHVLDASEAGQPHAHLRRFKVRCVTLDSLCPDPRRVSFVKMDAEGHEPHILRGARAMLEQGNAGWLVEAPGNPYDLDTVTGQIFKSFRDFGYKPYYWDGRDLRAADGKGRHTNYVFRR